MSATALSDAQQELYNLLQKGATADQIATKLGKGINIINAQITRIKNKGLPIDISRAIRANRIECSTKTISITSDNTGSPMNQKETVKTDKEKVEKVEKRPVTGPDSCGPTSNEAIARELDKAGQANYDIPSQLREIADKHGEKLDVHPMILLGVTIQFVKLCGGRIHAHQLIEDVYSALKAMVND